MPHLPVGSRASILLTRGVSAVISLPGGEMPEIVVVGGGIGGLQLGAMLSYDGHEVHVLEKTGHVGGRARPRAKDGFTVDNGIHLIRFGPASATARVFEHIERSIAFKRLGDSYVGFPDGSVEKFPTRPSDIVSTGMIDDRERAVVLAMLAFWRGVDPSRKLATTARGLLDAVGLQQKLSPYLGPLADRVRERWTGSRLHDRLQLLEPEETMEMSVADWLDALELGTGLRQYFQMVAMSMQVCPFIERASAGEMIANIKRVLATGHSVTYPRSGWRHILSTLSAVIEQNGAIKTNTEVRRVRVEDGRAVGVELTSGDTIPADRVVLDLPARELLGLFDDDLLDANFAARCRAIRPTAGIVLDFGLKRPVSFDTGLWYLWEPMAFGTFTSNLCPETAPSGKQLLTFLMPVDADELDSRADELESDLEAELFRTFKGLEDAIQWRSAMRLDLVDGVEVSTDQHRGLRPDYRVPGVDDLFLVGDWLRGAGAGGDIGHESVLGCYDEITRTEGDDGQRQG
jgi:phytoene dehydrogenase-like protein